MPKPVFGWNFCKCNKNPPFCALQTFFQPEEMCLGLLDFNIKKPLKRLFWGCAKRVQVMGNLTDFNQRKYRDDAEAG